MKIKLFDEITEEQFEYFRDCLPPLFMSKNAHICSEPYNFSEHGTTYICCFEENNKFYKIITTVKHFKEILKEKGL